MADADYLASLIVGSWVIIVAAVYGLLVSIAEKGCGGAEVELDFEGGEEENTTRGRRNQFSHAYHRNENSLVQPTSKDNR